MHIYNEAHGEQLVKAARNSIELFMIDNEFSREVITNTLSEFHKPHGVFVTLEHYPTRTLRGCIGFPRAVAPLQESVVEAAISAAFEDPRFVPVSRQEFPELMVEVSILSSPELLKGGERARLGSITVPGDGLMIEYGIRSGLLLPVVAAEQNWGKKRFLEETCKKAGLHHTYWSQENVKLYRFETQVFREESPNGSIIEVKYDNNKRK